MHYDDKEKIIQSLKNFSTAAQELATCLEVGFKSQEDDIMRLETESSHLKETLRGIGSVLKDI